MIDTGTMLTDSAERLFKAHGGKAVQRASDDGIWPKALWDAVEEAGFCAALLPEASGGFGATTAEAMQLVRIAAAHAAPIPLAETMLAGWLLSQAGLAVPPGALSLAPVRRDETLEIRHEGDGWRLCGRASRIPWGRDCAGLAVLAAGPDDPMVACVSAGTFTVEPAYNLAKEPRDALFINAALAADAVAPAPAGFNADSMRKAGAAIRTAQIAGALSRLLPLCVQYVQARVQFGRPIGKFQAIQHNLALLAGHAAAAAAAADMAADALENGLDPLVIGAAKGRAGEAASLAAGLAHQVHGAMGFTQEYELHYLTRRLWSWRDEFGKESDWYALVGRAALQAGGDGLWFAITDAA